MYARVYKFLTKHNILSNEQFGFRRGHSTTLAIINVIDKLYEKLDMSEFAIGIYLDIQKAFDCVNRNILIRKLWYYGIRGIALNWFISYLNNRQQFVYVNNTKSSVLPSPPQLGGEMDILGGKLRKYLKYLKY